MEFKKCMRCGSFFMSGDSICYNCEPKDRFDMANLNSFISGNPDINSIPDLSVNKYFVRPD